MSRRSTLLALALLAAVIASPVHAVRLEYGSRAEAIWDDNVFFASTDEVDDFSLRASPFFDFADDTGEFEWSFRYTPSYEYFFDQASLRGWDHDIKGSVEWRPNPRWRLRLAETFQRFSSLSRLNQETSTDLEDPSSSLEFLAERQRIKRNITGATIEFLPTKRSSLTLSGEWTVWDFALETRRDQETTSASLQYLYFFTPRLRAGVLGGWSRQEFDTTPTAPRKTTTDYYNLSGVAIMEVSPTFSISMSAGPAKIDGQEPEVATAVTGLFRPRAIDPATGQLSLIQAASCPRVDGFLVLDASCDPGVAIASLGVVPIVFGPISLPGAAPAELYPELAAVATVPVLGSTPGNGGELTYFANVGLVKSWEEWEARLSYQRRDDASGGFGVASVADIVNGSIRYEPSPYWTFTLTGSWIQRTQEQELVRLLSVVVPRELTADPDVRQALIDGGRGDPGATAAPGSAALDSARIDSFDSEIEITTIRFSFDVRHRLTRRISLFGTLFWVEEESTGDFRLGRSADRFTVRFGLVFTFDPIRFAGI